MNIRNYRYLFLNASGCQTGAGEAEAAGVGAQPAAGAAEPEKQGAGGHRGAEGKEENPGIRTGSSREWWWGSSNTQAQRAGDCVLAVFIFYNFHFKYGIKVVFRSRLA